MFRLPGHLPMIRNTEFALRKIKVFHNLIPHDLEKRIMSALLVRGLFHPAQRFLAFTWTTDLDFESDHITVSRSDLCKRDRSLKNIAVFGQRGFCRGFCREFRICTADRQHVIPIRSGFRGKGILEAVQRN